MGRPDRNDLSDRIAELYRAFNAREIDPVLAAMHPDVDWPNGQYGGRVHGQEAVREYWTTQWSQIDPHVEPVRIDVDENERALVEVRQTVRDLSGHLLDERTVWHRYHFRDGLIERMDIE